MIVPKSPMRSEYKRERLHPFSTNLISPSSTTQILNIIMGLLSSSLPVVAVIPRIQCDYRVVV